MTSFGFKSLRNLIAISLGLSLASCVTPMGPGEVERLTTCENTNLKKISKNLLLAGYVVQNQTDEHLTTEYKQTSGYGGNRQLERITVVKMGPKKFRFMVRNKREGYDSMQTGTSETQYGHGRNANTASVRTTHNQLVKTENETDQSYYQEYLTSYQAKKAMVCGGY